MNADQFAHQGECRNSLGTNLLDVLHRPVMIPTSSTEEVETVLSECGAEVAGRTELCADQRAVVATLVEQLLHGALQNAAAAVVSSDVAVRDATDHAVREPSPQESPKQTSSQEVPPMERETSEHTSSDETSMEAKPSEEAPPTRESWPHESWTRARDEEHPEDALAAFFARTLAGRAPRANGSPRTTRLSTGPPFESDAEEGDPDAGAANDTLRPAVRATGPATPSDGERPPFAEDLPVRANDRALATTSSTEDLCAAAERSDEEESVPMDVHLLSCDDDAPTAALATTARVHCVELMEEIMRGDIAQLHSFVQATVVFLSCDLQLAKSPNSAMLTLTSRTAYLIRHAVRRAHELESLATEGTSPRVPLRLLESRARGVALAGAGFLAGVGPVRALWLGCMLNLLEVRVDLESFLNVLMCVLSVAVLVMPSGVFWLLRSGIAVGTGACTSWRLRLAGSASWLALTVFETSMEAAAMSALLLAVAAYQLARPR